MSNLMRDSTLSIKRAYRRNKQLFGMIVFDGASTYVHTLIINKSEKVVANQVRSLLKLTAFLLIPNAENFHVIHCRGVIDLYWTMTY